MTRFTVLLAGLLLGGCATTIRGKVVSTGEPAPLMGGKVNVQRLNGPRLSVIANVEADGSFETVGDLPEGDYLVEPLIPGFTSESKTVKTSESHDLTFNVTPIPLPRRSAIGASANGVPARGEGTAVLTPPQM